MKQKHSSDAKNARTSRDPGLPLDEVLRCLRGKPVWAIAAGPDTGRVLSLEIGGKVALKTVSRNPELTADQRKFQGEYIIFVESAWRLTRHKVAIAGSEDEEAATRVRELIGKRIRSSVQSDSDLTVSLDFSDGYNLTLFSDRVGDGGDSFSFFTPEVVFIVGGGTLRTIPRLS